MSLFDQMVTMPSLSPATLTNGTADGVAVDRTVNGGMQNAVLVVSTGAVTDGSHAVSVQDSPDGATDWLAVPSAQLQGDLPTITSTDDAVVVEVGIRHTRQFLRAVIVTTGATSGGVIGAAIALNAPRFSPVSH